jgi:hypothetical protein
VEFEVEKDREAAAAELVNDGIAFGEVELEADFEPAAASLELVGESERGSSARNVQGDDQAGVHRDRVQRAGALVAIRKQETGEGDQEGTGFRAGKGQGGGERILLKARSFSPMILAMDSFFFAPQEHEGAGRVRTEKRRQDGVVAQGCGGCES